MTKTIEVPANVICLYPGCVNTRRTRGQCHQHYQTMRQKIAKGLATEADLTRRGLLLPKGGGGSPVKHLGHSAFLKGATELGDAHPSITAKRGAKRASAELELELAQNIHEIIDKLNAGDLKARKGATAQQVAAAAITEMCRQAFAGEWEVSAA